MHKTQTQSTESICPSDPTVHKSEMLKGEKRNTDTCGGGGWNQICANQVNISVPFQLWLSKQKSFRWDSTFHLQGETQGCDLEVIGLTGYESLALCVCVCVLNREQSSKKSSAFSIMLFSPMQPKFDLNRCSNLIDRRTLLHKINMGSI